MKLSYHPYFLEFHHPFRLASGTRTGTETVFVKLTSGSYCGFGEITLPPYVKEKKEMVIEVLKKIASADLTSIIDLTTLHDFLLTDFSAFPFTRCAVEEAWKMIDEQKNGCLETDVKNNPDCTFTIGIGEEEENVEKVSEGADFPILKIKCGSGNDKQRITHIRTKTNKPFCIDANQGWKNLEESVTLSHYLKTQNVKFIEQPFPAKDYELHLRMKERSALPVIADESIQGISDLKKYYQCFHGINIKLLKCGGPVEAMEMIRFAKEHQLFILIGCMSESGCGVYHAAKLRGYAELLDLDGPYLIKNNPFSGFSVQGGKVHLSTLQESTPLNWIQV